MSNFFIFITNFLKSLGSTFGKIFFNLFGFVFMFSLFIFGFFYVDDVVSSWQNDLQDVKTQAEFNENYEIDEDTQDDILNQVFKFTDSELDQMTLHDKYEVAHKYAWTMQVHTLDFVNRMNTDLDFVCNYMIQTHYDGDFIDYKLDSKWGQLFGQPLSTMYDIQYRTNIFDADSYNRMKKNSGEITFSEKLDELLPIDYKHEKVFNYQVEDSSFDLGVAQRIDFTEKIQVVLPDNNDDGVVDDRDLILLVRVKSNVVNSPDSNSNYKYYEIPIQVRNGNFKFISKKCSLTTEDQNNLMDLFKVGIGGFWSIPFLD